MELLKTIKQQCMTIEIKGWLDIETAPQLQEEVEQLPETITKLVLNCKQMEYISSAGLRTLVFIHKKMTGKEGLFLIGINGDVESVLRMSGLYCKLHIGESNEK